MKRQPKFNFGDGDEYLTDKWGERQVWGLHDRICDT